MPTVRDVSQQALHASPRKRTLEGIFLPMTMAAKETFSKPALPIEDQLSKLLSKGLTVTDPDQAKLMLRNIGFYRLSGYSHPFRSAGNRSRFKAGTTFDQIVRLYEFDRRLRLLVGDAIDRCEVAIRAQIVNETAIRLGAHWFVEPRHFNKAFQLSDLQSKIENAVGIRFNPATNQKEYPQKHSETFISHYYSKYDQPKYPPIWMTAETLSFGVLSRMLSYLADEKILEAISKPFGFHHTVFRQWVFSLSYLRNLCAHHNRLWNRVFSIPPKVAKKHKGMIPQPDRFYAFAVVLFDLLKSIQGGDGWALRLRKLMDEFPEIDPLAMGFPADWHKETFWSLSQSP